MIAIGPNTQPKSSFVSVLGDGRPEPIPDFLFNYQMTEFEPDQNGNPFPLPGPALPDKEALGFFIDSQFLLKDGDSASVATGSLPFSISFWVDQGADPVTNAGTIISTGSGIGGDGFEIRMGTDRNVSFAHNSIVSSSTTTPGEGFHFVTIAYEGIATNALNFYMNGSFINGITHAAPVNMTDTTFMVVARSLSSINSITGIIDDLRFYDRELSLSEHQALFAFSNI